MVMALSLATNSYLIRPSPCCTHSAYRAHNQGPKTSLTLIQDDRKNESVCPFNGKSNHGYIILLLTAIILKQGRNVTKMYLNADGVPVLDSRHGTD